METIKPDQEKSSAEEQPVETAASGPAIPLGADGDSSFSAQAATAGEPGTATSETPSAEPEAAPEAEKESAPEAAPSEAEPETAPEAAEEKGSAEAETPQETASSEDDSEPDSGSAYGVQDDGSATVIDENSRQHNAAFRLLGKATPVTMLLFLAAVCWPVFLVGDGFCPGEAVNIKFFGAAAQSPLLPQADGLVALPGFTWLGALVLKCFPAQAAGLSVLSALGAFIALIGVWGVCRLLRLGRYTPLAACLALFCMPAFLAFSQFVGPVMTATGLSLLALGILGRAWTKDLDYPGMILGNLLAAAAGLTGGLLYALLPVISAFILCLWRCSFRRARQTDAIIGFAVFLFSLAIWAALAVMFTEGTESSAVVKALIRLPSEPAVTRQAVFLYLAGSLPAILVIFCGNWPRILRGSLAELKASRTDPKTAILWIGLFVTLFLTVLTPHAADVFPAMAITAVLAGQELLRLGKTGSRVFFILVTIVLLAAGFFCCAATLPGLQHWTASALGLNINAAAEKILADLAGLSLIKTIVFTALPVLSAAIILHVVWRSVSAAAGLLVTAVMVVVMAQPFGLFLAPSLREMPSLQLRTYEHLNDVSAAAPRSTNPVVTETYDFMKPESPATAPGSPAVKPQAKDQAPAAPAAGTPEKKDLTAAPDSAAKVQPKAGDAGANPAHQAPSGMQAPQSDQYSSVLQQKPSAPAAPQAAEAPKTEQKGAASPAPQEKDSSARQPQAAPENKPAPKDQSGTAI